MPANARRARRRGFTRLTRKHQLTIPVSVLSDSGVRPGDELRVRADGDGRIVVERERDPLDRFVGAAPDVLTPDELAELRREWDA